MFKTNHADTMRELGQQREAPSTPGIAPRISAGAVKDYQKLMLDITSSKHKLRALNDKLQEGDEAFQQDLLSCHQHQLEKLASFLAKQERHGMTERLSNQIIRALKYNHACTKRMLADGQTMESGKGLELGKPRVCPGARASKLSCAGLATN